MAVELWVAGLAVIVAFILGVVVGAVMVDPRFGPTDWNLNEALASVGRLGAYKATDLKKAATQRGCVSLASLPTNANMGYRSTVENI